MSDFIQLTAIKVLVILSRLENRYQAVLRVVSTGTIGIFVGGNFTLVDKNFKREVVNIPIEETQDYIRCHLNNHQLYVRAVNNSQNLAVEYNRKTTYYLGLMPYKS